MLNLVRMEEEPLAVLCSTTTGPPGGRVTGTMHFLYATPRQQLKLYIQFQRQRIQTMDWIDCL